MKFCNFVSEIRIGRKNVGGKKLDSSSEKKSDLKK